MMDVGPKEWSTNFNHDEFYSSMTESLQSGNNIKNVENEYSQGWSKNYQPGYMFRNLGMNLYTLISKLSAYCKIIEVLMCNWHLPIM